MLIPIPDSPPPQVGGGKRGKRDKAQPKAFNLILRKEHLTHEGIEKFVSIKASMNNGQSDILKEAFPNILPVLIPEVKLPDNVDSQWIAGFVEAEGCFFVNIIKATTKSGFAVSLMFKITQHAKDLELLGSLTSYLSCGQVYLSKDRADLVVSKLADLELIMEFFKQSALEGSKAKDLADFYRVFELVKNKAHLTEEGLEAIRTIKAGMNRGRLD